MKKYIPIVGLLVILAYAVFSKPVQDTPQPNTKPQEVKINLEEVKKLFKKIDQAMADTKTIRDLSIKEDAKTPLRYFTNYVIDSVPQRVGLFDKGILAYVDNDSKGRRRITWNLHYNYSRRLMALVFIHELTHVVGFFGPDAYHNPSGVGRWPDKNWEVPKQSIEITESIIRHFGHLLRILPAAQAGEQVWPGDDGHKYFREVSGFYFLEK